MENNQIIFTFDELTQSQLIVDAIYEGGAKGNIVDEPISKILPVGNSGGIRKANIKGKNAPALVVLYTTRDEIEWPDELDVETGVLRYYGDNRTAGNQLINTKFKGNKLFEDLFYQAQTKSRRQQMPPVFVFEKTPTKKSKRSVRFLGLAVPGSYAVSIEESLLSIWRYEDEQRFQNYEALFSILDVQCIKRDWVDDLLNGHKDSKYTPPVWKKYIESGLRSDIVLQADKTHDLRSKTQQLPKKKRDIEMLQYIINHFGVSREMQNRFEHFTKMLIQKWDSKFSNIDLTRPWKDGGIDGYGYYKIKHPNDSLDIPFAFEAKCYKTSSGIGVKKVNRLIARIKQREFGVFVTTSYINKQAFKEVIEDKHPILFVTGKDIIDILKQNRINTMDRLRQFIESIK